MSIHLQKTLDRSEEGVAVYHRYLLLRHRRIVRLIAKVHSELAEHPSSAKLSNTLERLLRVYSSFTTKLILQLACLQEERNMYYFSMKDLEAILYHRQNET